jgi:hypothetical protein
MMAMFVLFAALVAVVANAAPTFDNKPQILSRSSNSSNLTYITLEEHAVPVELASYPEENASLQFLINSTFGPGLMPQIEDANTTRLQAMSNNSIKVQVRRNMPSQSVEVGVYNALGHQQQPHRLYQRHRV